MNDVCDELACPFLGCASCAYAGGALPAAPPVDKPAGGVGSNSENGCDTTRPTEQEALTNAP